MPALVAGIHALKTTMNSKAWMAGTSPAMTAWMGRSQGPLVLGLVYDIVGVAILALALAGTKTLALFQQSGTYWNGNKLLFRTLMVQRIDARFGLPVLVVGFVLQLLGSLGFVIGGAAFWALIALLGIVFVAWLIARAWSARTADSRYDRLQRELEAKAPRP